MRAAAVHVAALAVWVALIGVPDDPIGVFLWLWVAGIACNIEATRSYHRRFPPRLVAGAARAGHPPAAWPTR